MRILRLLPILIFFALSSFKALGQSSCETYLIHFSEPQVVINQSTQINPDQKPLSKKQLSQLRVIEVIKYRQSHGLNLNSASVVKDNSEEFLSKLQLTFESPISASAFMQRAEAAFGSWPKAVAAAGFNLDKVTSSVLTELDIKNLLITLKQKNVDLNSKNFRESKDPEILKIIVQTLNINLNPSQIYTSAIRFKKWADWLKEINFKSKHVQRRWSSSLTKDQVVEVIKKLHQVGIALNSKGIGQDNSVSTVNVIYNQLGFSITGSTFYAYALRLGKELNLTWDDFLKLAGLDPNSIRKYGINIPEEKIIILLKYLNTKNIPLNVRAIDADTSLETQIVIQDILGFKITGQHLYSYLVNQGKSWDQWLLAAEINLNEIKKTGLRLTEEQIVSSIQALNQNHISLNVGSINSDNSESTALVLKSNLGVLITGKRLYGYAVKQGRTWDDWLRLSGLNPNAIRKSGFNFSDETIIKVLLKLYEQHVPLNVKAISYDNTLDTEKHIESVLGFPMKGSAFYAHVSRSYGLPWAVWLSKAGFDVTKIQLRGNIPYNLVNRLTQMSLKQMESYRSSMLGGQYALQFSGDEIERIQVTDLDAETILIQKEVNDEFQLFNETLSDQEKILIEHLLEGLEQGYGLQRILEQLLDKGLIDSPDEIYNLFAKIRKHPKFIELLSY